MYIVYIKCLYTDRCDMFATRIMLFVVSCEAIEFGRKVLWWRFVVSLRQLCCYLMCVFRMSVVFSTYQCHIEVHSFFGGLKTYISLCFSIPNDKAPMIANSTHSYETNYRWYCHCFIERFTGIPGS